MTVTTGRGVGVIGLGAMGSGMAAHLVRSGFRVAAYDLRPEAVATLVAGGIRAASSPRDAATGADVVITSLPTPEAVVRAALGSEGLIAGLATGAVYVDMSTSDPKTTLRLGREVATRGAAMLDVPVGMGPEHAARGELTLMVGGEPNDIRRADDVLEALGARRFECGPLGSGHAMKLVNNLVSCAVNALVAEAMALGAKDGLDPAVMQDVMSNTAADNWHVRNSFPIRVFRGEFDPTFKLALAHKDLRLALSHAAAQGLELTTAAGGYDLHERALASGLGDEDQTAVIKVLEARTGVPVRAPREGAPRASPRPLEAR